MTLRKEMRLRYFEQAAGQQHIESGDHFLYQRPVPHLNFAVIGTGTIGLEHMRVTWLEGRARIAGVYDPAPNSVKNALTEYHRLTGETPKVYESIAAACADSSIDAYIICGPNHTHFETLRTVVKTNRAILLEKPMATTVADAAEIVRLADQASAPVQVGLQYRYKAIYVEARHEALERKSLGRIHQISMTEHRPPFLDKVNQWNKFSCYSGGTLVEKCCHYFDLMNLFADQRPARVFASGGKAVNFTDFQHDGKPADIADHAFVVVDFDNGVRANLNLNMFSPNFYEELTLNGEQGRLSASESFDYLHGEVTRQQVSVEHDERNASRVVKPRYPEFIEASGHHGSTYFEHLRFVDNIDGKETDAATVREGFWSIAVGAAAELSMKSGQPQELATLIDAAGAGDLIAS